MSNEPEKREDKRTRVDRILDRFKNNRVAAVFIVAAIVLAGVAGVTDSLRKLADALPALSSTPDLAGEWRSTPAAFYPVGPEIMVLRLREAVDDRLLGQVEFLTPDGEPRSERFDLLE